MPSACCVCPISCLFVHVHVHVQDNLFMAMERKAKAVQCLCPPFMSRVKQKLCLTRLNVNTGVLGSVLRSVRSMMPGTEATFLLVALEEFGYVFFFSIFVRVFMFYGSNILLLTLAQLNLACLFTLFMNI